MIHKFVENFISCILNIQAFDQSNLCKWSPQYKTLPYTSDIDSKGTPHIQPPHRPPPPCPHPHRTPPWAHRPLLSKFCCLSQNRINIAKVMNKFYMLTKGNNGNMLWRLCFSSNLVDMMSNRRCPMDGSIYDLTDKLFVVQC